MRKLSPVEQNAINYMAKHGSVCPGEQTGSVPHGIVLDILNGLVRKKRATVEMTDDGPRYHLTAQGHADAQP